MLIVFLKSNTDKTYPLLDTNSREGKTASVIHSPGESPIPEGTVRRFHVTGADPEDIKSKGILQSSARGIEGPKAIYSFDNWKHAREYGGDKSPVVEFWDHPESYNDHPQARIGDVPPNQIVQVHEPWHDRYRYLVNNPVAIDSARNLVSRDTEGSFKDYARALAHIDNNLIKAAGLRIDPRDYEKYGLKFDPETGRMSHPMADKDVELPWYNRPEYSPYIGMSNNQRFRTLDQRNAIKRGKKSLLSRINLEEKVKNGLSPSTAEGYRRFINSMPDDLTQDLASSYLKDPPVEGASGIYDPGARLFTIGKDHLENQVEPERTLPHEIAHHLHGFVHPEDMKKLELDYLSQRFKHGDTIKNLRGRINEIAEAQNNYTPSVPLNPNATPQTLNSNQRNFMNDSYRYKSFPEWFAENMADHAITENHGKNMQPGNRGIFANTLRKMNGIKDHVANFFGQKRQNNAPEIYNNLKSGKYSNQNLPQHELYQRRALQNYPNLFEKSILTKQDLNQLCKEMDWNPTEAQREAGNYKKAKLNIHGLTITIENPVGSVRTGIDRDGKQWSVKMKHPYGYINRTLGADAPDQVDVIVGPRMDSEKVYVVNQTKVGSKEFDEHKVVIGCDSKSEARQVYLDNYSPGWNNYSSIVELNLDELKHWLENGDMSQQLNPSTFFPTGNQLKKSFDIIVILSKADPVTTPKPNAPPFYSGLHRHLEAKLPNRATPEQVQGMVKNFPKEEVESSGIGKHLSVHFRPSNVDGIRFPDDWTKKNLLDTVKRNAPIIEETHYADDDRPISLSDPVTIGEDPRTNISEYKVHHPGIGYLGKIHSIRGEGNPDIFHLSVTHPYGKAGDELYSSGQFGNLEDAVYAAQSRANERTKNSRYKINENNKPIYTPGIKNYRELLMHLPSKGTDNEDDYEEDDYSHPSAMDEPLKAKGDYHGPHWSVPNVVAHLRMGELNDKEGKPVTHLDEIQSDLHQRGREHGYNTAEQDAKDNQRLVDSENNLIYGSGDFLEDTDKHNYLKHQILMDRKRRVPDLPFKKNWHELAFKRGIRHAAEQGHDKLTWDLGDTHNDRYDLAHHAKSIEFSPETNKLRVHTPSGNVQDLDIPDGRLEEYVGKDIADKLMNSSGGDGGSFAHKLDLDKNTTVGGSGHRYFYDQMIPSYAKKLARMYGGNYGQSEVQTENGPKTVHHLELSPEMKRVALEEGFPMFGDRDPLKKSFDVVFMLKSYTYHPLEQQAIDYFGTTGNPREAGYVLRDGTMLDFSGKKFGRGDRGYSRAMDHTEIGAIGCRPVDFMDQVGAVRFHSNPTGESYAALVHPLSPHQENAIRATARIGRPFSIDAGKKNAPIGGEYYQYPYHAYQDSVDFASPGKTREMIAEASKIAANTLHIPVQPRLDGLNKSTTANVLFKAYKATQHTPEETEKLYTAAKELHGHGNAVKNLKDKHWLYPDGTFSKSFGHYHPFSGAGGLTHAESANDIYEKAGVPIPDAGYENNYMDARAGLGRAGMIRITPRKNGYAVETASRPTPHQMSSIQQLYSMYKPSRDADSEWGGFDYDVRHPVTDQNVGYGNNLGDFYKHLEQAYGDNTEKAVILKAFKSTQHTPEEIDKLHATAKELLGHGSSAKETTGKAFLYPDGTFTKRIDKMDPIRGYRVGSHPGKAYDVYRNSGVNVPDIGYGDNYMDAHAGLTRTGMIRTTPMGNGYGFDMAARPTPSQMSTMQQMHDAFRPFGDEEEGGFHYEIRHPETDKYVASGDKISDLHNHLNEVFGPEDVEKSALGDFGRNVYGAAKRGLSKFIGIFKPAKPAPTENVPKEEIPKPEAEPKVSGVPKEPEELKTTELPPAELPEPVTAESPDAPSGGGVNLPKGTPSSPNAPSFSSQHENCQCSVINAGGGKQQWVLGPKACKNCQKMAQDFNNYHMDEQPDDESHNPDHAETEDGLD